MQSPTILETCPLNILAKNFGVLHTKLICFWIMVFACDLMVTYVIINYLLEKDQIFFEFYLSTNYIKFLSRTLTEHPRWFPNFPRIIPTVSMITKRSPKDFFDDRPRRSFEFRKLKFWFYEKSESRCS